MMKYVGLDIGAKSFEVAVRSHGKTRQTRSFEQTPSGHAQATRWIGSFKPNRVVMEATGVYHLDLALALFTAGLPVCVINPRSGRRFAELTLTQSKTDWIDARLLAEYAERMTPLLWTAPAPSHMVLRDLGRQINRLTHRRTQAKNRLHALQAKANTPRLLIEDEQEGIHHLDQRIERLTKAALESIKQCDGLAEGFQVLCSAKGVGQASAVAILAELCVLPEELKAKQVACHAGLDVRLNQSGISIDRPGRLSKHGNTYLRAAMFMPAMCAVRHDPRAKAFYETLLARGKKRIQAICAVMRKYLTGLWACLKQQTPFDSAALFSDIHFKEA